ncbi:MAG TPA: hypothetical protein VGD94_20105 [Vicinamibacterales bacterium]
MRYSAPELVVVGSASVLVLGGDFGELDNPGSETSKPMTGVALGLD